MWYLSSCISLSHRSGSWPPYLKRPSFVQGLLHCHRTTPRGLWGFMKKIHLQCLATVVCEYAHSAHMYIYNHIRTYRYNMMCNYVILSFSHERIYWCSIVIYILMLYYGSEWVCWCFQNRWLNLSMAGLIGRYCALMHLKSTLKQKTQVISTKRKETQNRLDSSIFQLPFGGNCHVTTVGRHLLSKIHERCRNCQGNIPIMVRSQKCNLYSAWTEKRGRES